MDILGNYSLLVKFGDVIVPISPQMIEEFTITQDLDRIVPTFKLRIKDATGLLGDIIPYDKNMNTISVELCRTSVQDDLNEFKFAVKRRKATFNKFYEIEGMLDVPNLYAKYTSRALTGKIKTNLETIAKEEMGIQDTEIGISLDYEKTIIQPSKWNLAMLFRYLKQNLIGKNREACYYCFVKNVRGKPILVFKSVDELFSTSVKYRFVVGSTSYENFYPVVDYRVYDNSQLVTDFGALIQTRSYFDYENGEWITAEELACDYPSLSEYLLMDSDNDNESVNFRDLGRSNDFTLDFKGRVKGDYFDRMTNLVNMQISTWGMENLAPGDIVKLIFAEAMNRGDMFIYEHSGYWLVKRITHIIGMSFMSNIMLTRAGIDSDMDNTLLSAGIVKKND